MNSFSVSFTVPGIAVAKGRPKFARRGQHITAYTPEKTVSFENLVKDRAANAMKNQRLTMTAGPVQAVVNIYLPIPKSWPKKFKEMALAGQVGMTKKPDMDNIIKALFDAMNGIIFKDDSQVVFAMVRKIYSMTPYTEITIESTYQEAAK
jgi:Holliday junction resolvase RusA-like endonuclease